jgi:hypothetical protein
MNGQESNSANCSSRSPVFCVTFLPIPVCNQVEGARASESLNNTQQKQGPKGLVNTAAMKTHKPKTAGSRLASIFNPTASALALVLLLAGARAQAQGHDQRAPELTGPLAVLVPTDGSKVHFHAYAIGVQIYHWNAALGTWGASTPDALLFDADGNVVGHHYGGPTWESNSGSLVKGTREQGVTVNTNDVPWLLLKGRDQAGKGIFAAVTHIQRLFTSGGVAPLAPGSFDGQEARVPYTAQYFFYRADPSAAQ